MPRSRANLLLRHGWKLGFGLLAAGLLTARGVTQLPVHLPSHQLVAVTSDGPTTVQCGNIQPTNGSDAVWTAAHSPYILPANDPNLPTSDPAHPNCLKSDPANVGSFIGDDITVASGTRLIIDASQGPVQILSHGVGIVMAGSQLKTIGTGPTGLGTVNTVTFDREPEVASWDGLTITATDASHRGNASLSYVSIEHALNAVVIDSGATSTPDPLDPNAPQVPYGLAIANSGIGFSYFDGIEATNTPVSLTGAGDGKLGTVNNIGSVGLETTFDNTAPALSGKALNVNGITFGSSAPFAESGCDSTQPCYIGNQAILGTFVPGAGQPVLINNSQFFRAGNNGLQLESANLPVITNNVFACNGPGDTKSTGLPCVPSNVGAYAAIYLNHTKVDLTGSVTGNQGHDNGLDAVILNGEVTSSTLTWQNATNASALHQLGYLLNGDLDMNGGNLVVPGGSIVRTSGAINLTGGTLSAGDAAQKIFTSLRDPGIRDALDPTKRDFIGRDLCQSTFVQSCPDVLAGGEWGGLDLIGAGANGNLNKASVRYATNGVQIQNGATKTNQSTIDPQLGLNFGLVITSSHIGPTFADGVSAQNTPTAVVDSFFDCPAGVCSVANAPNHGDSAGNHGITADFTGNNHMSGNGLLVRNTAVQGSINEGLRAVGMAGQPVAVAGNTISSAGGPGTAGAAGIYIRGSDNLTLQGNTVKASGTGSPSYPAIWLDGVQNADFNAAISGNLGAGNGLDSLTFHGTTANTLTWISPTNVASNTNPVPHLGYAIDDSLTVNGDLNIGTTAYAPVLRGAITVKGGSLNAQAAAVVTSLREKINNFPTCGSIFVPAVSGNCPLFPQAADYWGGFSLDPGFVSSVSGSGIRYAGSGLVVRAPGATPSVPNLIVTDATIRNISGDAIKTSSPLKVQGGSFLNIGQNGIEQTLTAAPSGAKALNVSKSTVGSTTFNGIGQAAITSNGLSGADAQVTDTNIVGAGTYGILLQSADHDVTGGSVTVTGNRITASGNPPLNSKLAYPAIELNGFAGPAANIANNTGAGNGLNALSFHGTLTTDLTWATARQTNTAGLGFILDGNLDMQAHQLSIAAGDIVKSSGSIKFTAGSLKADDTSSASQKVLTSLSDDSAGVPACGSALLIGCIKPAPGDWAGLVLSTGASGNLVNGSVRYATTGLSILNGATGSADSSLFGVTVSRSAIGPSSSDGINAAGTAISVTDSTFVNLPSGPNTSPAVHGIVVDLTNAPPQPNPPPAQQLPLSPLRLSGNRFVNTQAEALVARALANHVAWITDNQVQGAGTFGMRLMNADELVLRNNNVSGSGTTGAIYPAIYLSNVSGDFTNNIRGNVGRGDGLNAIALNGTVSGDLNWITPSALAVAATKPLGYLLDGGLTLDGGNLNLKGGDVVKTAGGITLKGGQLNANDLGLKIFTSLKDDGASSGGVLSCPSFFGPCGAARGNWGGIVLTDNGLAKGGGVIKNTLINYADTGIAIDSGPIGASPITSGPGSSGYRLEVSGGSVISNASKDGINSLDTPFSVIDSFVKNLDGHGIIASFFSPANCISTPNQTPTCLRMKIDNVEITAAGKDGIIANGLAGQPISVTNNPIADSGTYGIRLVGADTLTLTDNKVTRSAPLPMSSLRYPAIYLNGVTGDFGSGITGNNGSGNGINAVVFHGTATSTLTTPTFTWLTPKLAAGTFGYMLDGDLTVAGTFAGSTGDIVKVLNGGIKINGGSLQTTDVIFTSLKDGANGLTACNSVFIPGACAATAGDWSGITVNGQDSSVNGGQILFAGDGITTTGGLDLEDATLKSITGDAVKVGGTGIFKRDVFTGITNGYAIRTTSTGKATVECSAIHDNSGGIFSGGPANQLAITYSDLYNNGGNPGTKDLNAQVATSATSDWWGTAPPNAPAATQLPGPGAVTVTDPLSTQAPVLSGPDGSISLTSVNTNTLVSPTNHFGKGLLSIDLKFSRKMDTTVGPTVFFTPNAGTMLPQYTFTPNTGNGWDSNGIHWTGHFDVETSTVPIAGLETLVVKTAQSCVPEPSSNKFATDTTTQLTVDYSGATFVAGADAIPGSTSAMLKEKINPQGWSKESDTSVYFEITPLSGDYSGSPQLGIQPIGAGGADVTVSAPTSPAITLSTLTTYFYRAVVSDLNTGPVAGPEHSFTTTDTAHQFSVVPAATTVKAGDTFQLTITAQDATSSHHTVADYLGTVDLSLDPGLPDPTATLPTPQTFTVLEAGVHKEMVTLTKPGTQTITVKDSADSTILGSAVITVNPGNLDHFDAVTPGTQAAGTPFAAQVTAYDSVGNVKTDYSGGTVSGNLGTASAGDCSGLGTSCPPSYGSLSWVAGVGTISSVTAYKAEINRTLTITDGTVSKTTGPFTVTSTGTGTKLRITSTATSTKAGKSSSVITVEEEDTYNNPQTSSPALPLTMSSSNGLSGGGGTGTFYKADGTTALASPEIASGASSLDFTYSDTSVSTPMVTVSAAPAALTDASQAEAVVPGDLDHFSITTPGTQVAGTPFSTTVTALDAFNNVKTDYPGAGIFSGNLGTAAAGGCSGAGTNCPPSYGNAVWAAGVGTVSNVTAYKAETNRTLTITDGAISKTTGTFTVTSTGTGTKLRITSAAKSTKAGKASTPITVEQEDQYNNAQTTSVDLPLAFNSTNVSGSFFEADGTTPLPSPVIAGSSSSLDFTYSDSLVSTPTLTVSAPAPATLTDATQIETVIPSDLNHFAVVTPGTQLAGTPFASVQVTAYDAFNNVKTDYAGGATVSSNLSTAPIGDCSGPGTPCPPTYGTLTWGSGTGVGHIAGVRAYVAEDNRTLTVTDGGVSKTTNTFKVNPAGAVKLSVAGPLAVVVGTPFTLTVTAKDLYGNTATGYLGTIGFTSPDLAASLPDPYQFDGTDKGTKDFSVTLNTVGPQTVTATDGSNSSITGTYSVTV